jgi:uncharacterized protein (TIGR00375 family)
MQNLRVLDLHIHSHYSIPSSRDMNVENIYKYALNKGVNVVGSGDVLFPQWRRELARVLEENNNGTYSYKKINVILSSEVNLVFEKFGKLRKIHMLVTFPNFKSVTDFSKAIKSDLTKSARPTIHVDGKSFVEIAKKVNKAIQIIPAHIWTPWFGLLGSFSGFDGVDECFEDESANVLALETGLSADPALCYSVRSLRRFSLVSFSDAHSPSRIGREAVILRNVEGYDGIFAAIRSKNDEFVMTIEEFPENGKYFADGCRKCKFSSLDFTGQNSLCPICKHPLTKGVYHRIIEMPDHDDKEYSGIPFVHVIPLEDAIAQSMHLNVVDNRAKIIYNSAIDFFSNEINVLVFEPISNLKEVLPLNLVEAIELIRLGRVNRIPGYDGVYGKIILGG